MYCIVCLLRVRNKRASLCESSFVPRLLNVRTIALLALAACSAKFSGAAAPSAGFETSAASTVVDEWTAFLTKGLALDLLARHFEGIGKALTCM